MPLDPSFWTEKLEPPPLDLQKALDSGGPLTRDFLKGLGVDLKWLQGQGLDTPAYARIGNMVHDELAFMVGLDDTPLDTELLEQLGVVVDAP